MYFYENVYHKSDKWHVTTNAPTFSASAALSALLNMPTCGVSDVQQICRSVCKIWILDCDMVNYIHVYNVPQIHGMTIKN